MSVVSHSRHHSSRLELLNHQKQMYRWKSNLRTIKVDKVSRKALVLGPMGRASVLQERVVRQILPPRSHCLQADIVFEVHWPWHHQADETGGPWSSLFLLHQPRPYRPCVHQIRNLDAEEGQSDDHALPRHGQESAAEASALLNTAKPSRQIPASPVVPVLEAGLPQVGRRWNLLQDLSL